MTVIPHFILRRMYRQNSLRRLPEGVGFDIVNNLGPGQISRLNLIRMNEFEYPPARILLRINQQSVPALSITEATPATFFLNQVITCVVLHPDMPGGVYEIALDLISREAGRVTLTVRDTLAVLSV